MATTAKQGVGVFFYCADTDRFLYLLRADARNPDTWGLPGGGVDRGESLLAAIERECQEEIQYWPRDAKLIPLQRYVNNSFAYHTFFCAVDQEFVPQLNSEHTGYAWINSGIHPRPLHPGLFGTINFDLVKEKIARLQAKKQRS